VADEEVTLLGFKTVTQPPKVLIVAFIGQETRDKSLEDLVEDPSQPMRLNSTLVGVAEQDIVMTMLEEVVEEEEE